MTQEGQRPDAVASNPGNVFLKGFHDLGPKATYKPRWLFLGRKNPFRPEVQLGGDIGLTRRRVRGDWPKAGVSLLPIKCPFPKAAAPDGLKKRGNNP